MTLKQSVGESINEPDDARDLVFNCWQRGRDCPCLRVDLSAGEMFIFPYQQFLSARHTLQQDSETLTISFSTHEITVSGRELSEVASALQNLAVEWIKTIPARYRGLPHKTAARVTRIDLKSLAQTPDSAVG